MSNGTKADPLTTVAEHWTEAVQECLDAVKTSYEAALDESYDSDRWAEDMARARACGVKGWARLVSDATLLAAGLADASSAPETTEDGQPGDQPADWPSA